ncbi:MAG TPA: outer membrane beta-barrel protein [Bacteroidota bacterium]
MKSATVVIISLVLAVGIADAQFQKGTTELTLSGNLGSSTNKTSGGNSYYSYDHSETVNYAVLDLAVGFFLADGFSLEPEVALFAAEQQEPAQYLLANISYTMPNPSAKVAPFIRAGYGVSNSMKIPGLGIMGRMSDKLDVGVLNLGAGIKYLVASDVALRVEVNYRKHSYSHSDSFSGFTSSYEYSFATTGLLFGFSVLL